MTREAQIQTFSYGTIFNNLICDYFQQQNVMLEWEFEYPWHFSNKSIKNRVNELSKVKYFQSDLTAFDNLLKINLANVP